MADHLASTLLSSFRLGDLELPSRIVMAPMTRNRAGEDDVPTETMARYYAQRASAGLVVTEATQVCPEGVGYPSTPGIHTDAQTEGWRLVTKAVHEAGGRIFLQLWHVGRISHPSMQPGGRPPVAPSRVKPEGRATTPDGQQPFVTPRALEDGEVLGVIARFADGARRAREAGFDGVEVHGANGYLVDQFLRDGTNRRKDRWGGSVENRARFLFEVTETVCDVWDPERVGVRLSPTSSFNDMRDSDPEATFTHAAERLSELGIAYLHVVEAVDRGEEPRVTPLLREAFEGALMANGGYDRDAGHRAIAEGRADLVSFGRLFLANPDLPRRFALGAPLNAPDRSTFYGGDERGYVDYPTLAELEDAEVESAGR